MFKLLFILNTPVYLTNQFDRTIKFFFSFTRTWKLGVIQKQQIYNRVFEITHLEVLY